MSLVIQITTLTFVTIIMDHQHIEYKDSLELEKVISELTKLPPLVNVSEVKSLQKDILEATTGKRFIMHLGDCAEKFNECTETILKNKMNLFCSSAQHIYQEYNRPVTILARIAGQYAKPRSQATQNIDGKDVLTYRGDLINGSESCSIARQADPQRLIKGMQYSALTLNYLRSQMQERNLSEQYMNGNILSIHPKYNLFTSHEALSIDYESALTKEINGKYFNLGAHFLWLGMRTATLNDPVCNYLALIENPIGIKIGPSQINNQLLKVLDKLDPDNTPGRLTLIVRLGLDDVHHIEKLINLVNESGRKHLWLCDPMHGNTKTFGHLKTRYLDDISSEIELQMQAHHESGGELGGLHLEATGCDVTECIGANVEANIEALQRNYVTEVDPRLNITQTRQLLKKLFFAKITTKNIIKEAMSDESILRC